MPGTPTPRREPRIGPPVADILPDRLRSQPCGTRRRAAGRAISHARATQTVFGEGPRHAEIMMVGEQPGDVEDIEGHPFVGPAGRLLDRALEEASIDRALVYLTNVVKHFRWEPRGKRRIHAKPNGGQVAACRPWLETEIALVRPRVLVCLGAVAAQALLGQALQSVRRARPFRGVHARRACNGNGAPFVSILRAGTRRVAARRWKNSSPTYRVVAAEIPGRHAAGSGAAEHGHLSPDAASLDAPAPGPELRADGGAAVRFRRPRARSASS